MELISGPNEYRFPRNIALMMFSEHPEKYFPLTQVEIVYFPNGEAEAFEEYPAITGPVSSQIKQTLDFLRTNFLKEKVTKLSDVPESLRVWNYPLEAIEEILVNAFYHRDYQQREPIEIRIYANSMIFINHGGPDRSIQLDAFSKGKVVSRRYRNRRLGEFLKELKLTEGRATGIPTILKSFKDNGSKAPRFDTDEDRTFFAVEIFAHPDFENKKLDLVLDSENSGLAERNLQHINDSLERILNEDGDIARDIARDIAEAKIEKSIELMKLAQVAASRKQLVTGINLVKNTKNFETYIRPLVNIGWLSMTIPDKPTSPKQQYVITRKGQLLLKILSIGLSKN